MTGEARPPAEPEAPSPDAAPAPEESPAAPAAEATPKRRRRKSPAAAPETEKPAAAEPEAPKAPRRPVLDPELHRLFLARRAIGARRPKFVRQQSHRYLALRRPVSWRRPRGQQSKQRRHYGYRPTVVSIGFRSPRRARDLAPNGFRPVLVHAPGEIARLDPARDAALIARTVGTRLRLVIEEQARLKGIHVLNPLVREPREA